jgi:secretin/TonB-like protein
VRRRVRVLAACVALLVANQALAEPPQSFQDLQRDDLAGKTMPFEIPPQQLSSALRAYSEATGIAVLVDDSLVATHRSPGVSGVFTPGQALHLLLAGTGLGARYASPNAFTVVAVPDAPAAPIGEALAPAMDDAASAALQRSVMGALCANAKTRPGSFRLALQLWLDPQGRISRVHALGGSGRPDRDHEVAATLQGTNVGLTRVPGNPVTILILPAQADGRSACPATH